VKEEKRFYNHGDFYPEVDETVFVAPGAKIVGKVKIGPCTSIWYNSVVRGDADMVFIGSDTNIQDNCTLHEDQGFPLFIGDRVSVGHNCILHGCTIEDDTLIGMGTTILNGAKIGAGAVIGAGSLVVQGMEVPPGYLAMGLPAKIIRPLNENELQHYQDLAKRYKMRALFMLGQVPDPD